MARAASAFALAVVALAVVHGPVGWGLPWWTPAAAATLAAAAYAVLALRTGATAAVPAATLAGYAAATSLARPSATALTLTALAVTGAAIGAGARSWPIAPPYRGEIGQDLSRTAPTVAAMAGAAVLLLPPGGPTPPHVAVVALVGIAAAVLVPRRPVTSRGPGSCRGSFPRSWWSGTPCRCPTRRSSVPSGGPATASGRRRGWLVPALLTPVALPLPWPAPVIAPLAVAVATGIAAALASAAATRPTTYAALGVVAGALGRHAAGRTAGWLVAAVGALVLACLVDLTAGPFLVALALLGTAALLRRTICTSCGVSA